MTFLRDARWIDSARAVGYGRMVALLSIAGLIYIWIAHWRLGVDFLAFWSAARLTIEGDPSAAYDAFRMKQVQVAVVNRPAWTPFLNPPPFLFFAGPLGFLSFPTAAAVWLSTTYGVYLLVLRGLPNGAFWPAAAFPAAFFNAMLGQNGFVTASLFIGAILLLDRRPWLAGMLIGALVIKPHLAVLFPLALIAGRQWRAFAGAAISSAGALVLAVLVFGWDTAQAFLQQSAFTTSLLGEGYDVLRKLQSVFAAVRIAGAPPEPAAALQVISTVLAAAAVWASWRSGTDTLGKGAVLACATALATPYIFEYDLMPLVLALTWLGREGLRQGFRRWERLFLAGAFCAPALSRFVINYLHVSIIPVVCLALLVALLTRQGVISRPRSVVLT